MGKNKNKQKIIDEEKEDIEMGTTTDSETEDIRTNSEVEEKKEPSKFLQECIDRCTAKRTIHARSAQYYEKAYKFTSFPCLFITAASGILSFVSTSSSVDDSLKDTLALAVGISASISSLCQSINQAYNFNTKADAHRTAAESYQKLVTKLRFQLVDDSENNPKEILDSLENSLLEIQSNCKFFPPQHIENAYMK